MASPGARLRKTFKYPSDSEGSNSSRDEIDEEGKHSLPVMKLLYSNRHFLIGSKFHFFVYSCILPLVVSASPSSETAISL
jgi:hypothetical protein